MAEEYTIPSGSHVGHVHLKVADLDRAMDFYVGLLGFRVVTRHGDQAVFISAGGYIALNTWFSKDAPRASREGGRLVSHSHFISRKERPCGSVTAIIKS